ncbi:MAG TPA: hypothetical protein VL404_07315, partial [Candidatus Eisenbacteria bacterium]|nr:hypothetical protein [Candidatus Eisenbacteria bacterium]
LVVTANNRLLFEPRLGPNSRLLEKAYEYRFPDGAKLKIHFTDQSLEAGHESPRFARDVLDAAVQAYQTITEFQGFSTPGYSFADPDRGYAADPDRTIDVFVGDPSGDVSFRNGFTRLSFKDAPCFDTVRVGENEFQAVILLPSNYKEFIRNWERINPSSLGTRNVEVDLRGTLIHEMLHVVVFYYNRNLNKDLGQPETARSGRARKLDWYVEGLARYFETFAGARHDFFSQGFKQTLPDKIRFSRGGSNYFMRYPDQAFTDLRYENAIFWRFIDYRYGMEKIEKLSREFRNSGQGDFHESLERLTGIPFKDLLKKFALATLFNDFGLKDDAAYLKEIARTRLAYSADGFSLVDGAGARRPLGPVCSTDWIGRWDKASARLGEAPVAGDSTEKSDVSGWATDFYEISLDAEAPKLPWLGVRHEKGGMPLAGQIVLLTKGGSTIFGDLPDVPAGETRGLDLKRLADANGLIAADIDRVYVLVSNTDPKTVADYSLASKA